VTVRPLRLLGDPVLRTPCDPVLRFDAGLARLVRDLLDTVQVPGRAGLAANQIGASLAVAAHAVVTGVGLDQQPVVVAGDGELARCLQHETGHLRGELFIDGLAGPERRAVLRQLRQRQPARG